MGKEYTKEFLISEFWRWVHEHDGKTPTRNDFQVKYGYPSSFQYEKIFNTRKWNIILKQIGVEPNNELWSDREIDFLKNNWTKMNDEDIGKEINKTENGVRYKRLELDLYRQPQKQKWEDWEIEYLKESFYDAHQQEIEDRLSPRKWVTIKSYANKILKLKRQNYKLKNNKRKCRKCKNIFDENENNFYKDGRDSFHALCKTCFKEREEIRNRKKGVMTKKLKLEMHNNGYSYCGHCKEWKTIDNFSNDKHSISGFKKWCIECSRKNHRRYYLERTYGEDFTEDDYHILSKNLYDINGNKCDSIPEKLISDLLFLNNVKYIDHPYYRDYIQSDKSKKQFDWYLTEYKIAVEYFGMYDEKYINKNDHIGKYTRKTIKKINICKKNNIKLIDLYPYDLNDNYKGLIHKFNNYGIKLKIEENLKIS